MDVLTHALEAYVSMLATDYTDALAIQAAQMVFKYLPRCVKNGKNDLEAREKCTMLPQWLVWHLLMLS